MDLLKKGGSFRAFVGLDGFVDEIVHVVDKRTSPQTYTRVEQMKDFGEAIVSSAGVSTNFEFVSVQKKLGGNGPIFALGLGKLGAQVRYAGCVGAEGVHPIFSELERCATVIPVAEPGRTQAIEFFDGKLICSMLEPLNRLSWEEIVAKVGRGQLTQAVREAELISLNNWTMILRMNEIWESFLNELLAPLGEAERRKKTAFFDLADPNKRAQEDIARALELIGRFQQCGIRTALGLNGREAEQILRVLGGNAQTELEALCREIYAKLNIDCLVVHLTDRAACIQDGVYKMVIGPYCQKPRLTTGAGDSFNSGFVYGYVNHFPPEDSLTLAVTVSGYYVRNAGLGSREELEAFFRRWQAGQSETEAADCEL